MRESYPSGSTKTSRGRNHERSILPRLAVQSSHGEKHDGSWRMCVDFTDLNKACPQDCYPLLEIEWKIKSLYGYPFKYFLDAYKGYQPRSVLLHKNAFWSKETLGASNQGLVDKPLTVGGRKHGLLEGMFLGYTINPEGIKPCPDKTEAVLQLPSPRTIKKMGETKLQAKLKQHLSELPLLVAPKQKEELIIYLSASYGAVSAVLMTKRGAVQTPVYFISRALQGLELNYTPMEKLVLSLVFAAKRLQRYFQAHPITVITNQPIKQIISRPDVAERLQKWSVMLGETHIHTVKDVGLKGKILANFLERSRLKIRRYISCGNPRGRPWTLFTDGSSCVDGSGAEYEALIAGLRIAAQMGDTQCARKCRLYVSSKPGPRDMTPIMEYLKDGTLLGDRKEASKLRIKARQYELMEGILYRRSFLKPWLRTVVSSSKGYAARILLADHAPGCKRYDTYVQRLSNTLPCAKKPLATANPDHGSVAIEAKAVATIIGNQVKKFIWDNIVCRFDLPGEIISDNGKQFSDNPFKDWCDKLNITQRFASVKHSQSNGLVERANRSLGEGIKARLGEGNKNWIEELPHVLWAHRTMIKSSHGDTPFSLTYYTEAVIPTEIGMPTYRIAKVDIVLNDEELRLNLDLLEEKRPRDFVYHSNDASHAAAGGKLGPKWKGPYEVMETLGDGAYKLRTMDGADLPRTWNIANLKKCYL
ncbi:reverse transcriptase domain-containing protein [Tanacetum coccineum]